MSILLKNVADLNLMDSSGNTALHYSVCSEKTSIVAKLLAHKANIESKPKYTSPKIISNFKYIWLNSDMCRACFLHVET
jgi:ankyrin repeat protein